MKRTAAAAFSHVRRNETMSVTLEVPLLPAAESGDSIMLTVPNPKAAAAFRCALQRRGV